MNHCAGHRCLLGVALGIAIALSASLVSAQTSTWIGNTDASLGTAGNWSSLPASGAAWTFNAAGTAGVTLTNNLTTSAFNVAGITFTSSATSAYTISGGTFALTGNIALQSATTQAISSDIVVSEGLRTIGLVGGATLQLSGNLTGSGTISQTGAGSGVSSITLSGNNSGFTGAFTADNSSSTRTAINNTNAGSASAAWTFNRTVAGGVALNLSTGTIAFGSLSGGGYIRSNSGTITVRVGDLNTNSTFSGIFQVANSSTPLNVLKVGTGTLTLSGNSTTNGGVTISSGVVAATALANGGVASPLGQSSNSAANLVLNGGTLRYTGTAVTTDRLFSTGTSGGALEANGSGAVVFGGTGAMGFNSESGARTLTLSGTNTGTNTLAAALGDSGGATSLVKSGSGTWVLTGSNTHTGATTMNSGILAIGHEKALGVGGVTFSGNSTLQAATTGTIANAVTLNAGITGTFDSQSNSITLGGLVSGPGSFTKIGTGVVTLSNANTYTGTTTISGGTLRLSGTGTIGATTSTLGAIAAGAVLDLNGSNQTIAGFAGSSAGAIRNNSGAGVSVLSVTGASPGSFAGTIADNDGISLGGKVGLALNSAGTLSLSSSNAYSGGSTINAGGITITNASALGTGSLTLNATAGNASTLTLGNAWLSISNSITAAGSGTNMVIGQWYITGQVNGLTGGVTLADSNFTYRQTGNGGLRMTTVGVTGTGNVTFENNTTNNTNPGIDIRVAINNVGTLTFSGTGSSVTTPSLISRVNATGGSIGANVTSVIQDSLVTLDLAAAINAGSAATMQIRQGRVLLSNANALGTNNEVLVASGAILDVPTANTIAGLSNISGSGGLVTSSGTAARILTIGGGSSYAFAGVLADGTANTLGLTKSGTGTQILTGTSTFTGATAINGGSLIVNGALGATTTTVSAGALLGGSGSIGGLVTVSGTLSPGNSPGLITIASLVLNPTATTLIQITGTDRGTAYDGIDITTSGGLNYGGTLAFDFSSLFTDNTTFDIFSFTGSSAGAFTSVVSTGSYAGTWTNNNDGSYSFAQGSQTLTFRQATGDIIIVPEPGAVALAGIGLAGLIGWNRWRKCRSQVRSQPAHRRHS